VAAGTRAGGHPGGRVVVRAAAVAVALALLGPAPAAAKKPPGTQPHAPVGVVIISGTLQTVPAYVSPAASSYLTEYPHPLVVHIVGANPNTHRVRFSCGIPRCTLGVPNEPDGGKTIDARTYEFDAKNRQAALKITLTTPQPGMAVVWAEPVGDGTERIGRSAFLLTGR
jgi:hypothetical protein